MKHVLIIDDDQPFRLTLRASLEQADYHVADVSDCAQGLGACHQRTPDLILCALYMPSRDGLEPIRERRTRNPEVSIAAMGGGDLAGLLNFLPNRNSARG